MTDISTQQQSLPLPSARPRSLRFASSLLKYLFRSRRAFYFDPRHANAHLLKDIGWRPHNVPPRPSDSRLL